MRYEMNTDVWFVGPRRDRPACYVRQTATHADGTVDGVVLPATVRGAAPSLPGSLVRLEAGMGYRCPPHVYYEASDVPSDADEEAAALEVARAKGLKGPLVVRRVLSLPAGTLLVRMYVDLAPEGVAPIMEANARDYASRWGTNAAVRLEDELAGSRPPPLNTEYLVFNSSPQSQD